MFFVSGGCLFVVGLSEIVGGRAAKSMFICESKACNCGMIIERFQSHHLLGCGRLSIDETK